MEYLGQKRAFGVEKMTYKDAELGEGLAQQHGRRCAVVVKLKRKERPVSQGECSRSDALQWLCLHAQGGGSWCPQSSGLNTTSRLRTRFLALQCGALEHVSHEESCVVRVRAPENVVGLLR